MSKPFWPMGFGIVLSLAGMCPAQSSASAPAASQPSGIRIESPDYNFGKVCSGESVSHTFKFTNTGKQVVTIRNVSTSCGCTTTKDYARTVAPGGTWELAATLTTRGQFGNVTKRITVTTDAPPSPISHLSSLISARSGGFAHLGEAG